MVDYDVREWGGAERQMKDVKGRAKGTKKSTETTVLSKMQDT